MMRSISSNQEKQQLKPKQERWVALPVRALRPGYLPGDRLPDAQIAAMIRVNHAGETGACRIYRGQIAGARLKAYPSRFIAQLEQMLRQEQVHFAYFVDAIGQRQVRPSLLDPLWRGAGWLVGFGTGLGAGGRAAMLCTEAIETVIAAHYLDNLDYLMLQGSAAEEDVALAAAITKFRAEELEHRDEAVNHCSTMVTRSSKPSLGAAILSAAIAWGSRLAIMVAKRI